jgi:hypothetical protein
VKPLLQREIDQALQVRAKGTGPVADKNWKNANLTDEQHIVILSFGATCPEYWLDVVIRQANRIHSLQVELAGYIHEGRVNQNPIPEAYGSDARMSIPHLMACDGHLMVYAADHAVTICERYQALTRNDPTVSRAIANFRKANVDCRNLRDMFAHIEDYALGTGYREPGRQMSGPIIEFTDSDTLLGDILLKFGDETIAIYALTRELSILVTNVRSAMSKNGFF